MRRYLLIPGVVALAMSVGSMVTATPVVLNMDRLPEVEDPDWVGCNMWDGSASVGGGILTIDCPVDEECWSEYEYILDHPRGRWHQYVSNARGWVIETRMRVDPSTKQDPYDTPPLIIWTNDHVYCTCVGFSKEKVYIWYPDTVNYAMNTTDCFHVYRIEGKEDTFRLFVDGALAIDYHRSRVGWGSDLLAFGHWRTGRSYWDYFSYDTGSPLEASFEYSPDEPMVGNPIEFDASSSSPYDRIVRYEWDFGDGSTGWAIGPFYQHTYSTYGDRTVTLTVTDNDGQTDSCSKPMDRVPPKTKHTLSGENKHAINVTLTAEDEFSGVDVTKYVVWNRSGPEYHEGTQFTVDLDNVQSIIYFSIDKAGNREEGHEIRVTPVKEPTKFAKMEYAYDPHNPHTQVGPDRYDVYVQADYFRITHERAEIVFVDKVAVNTGPDLCGVVVIALGLYQGDLLYRTIKENTGFNSFYAEWRDIGVVDWTGRFNRYRLGIQLRSDWLATGKYLSEGRVPLLISPGGLAVGKKYFSDRMLSTNIPANQGFFKSLSDWLNPFQSKTHTVEIGGETTQASLSVSWPGSDLDLILYDPSGREINQNTASMDQSVHFVRGDTYEQYTIMWPVPSQWTMKIVAIDVPEDGEGYVATVDLSNGVAWNPDPPDGAGGVPRKTVLTWASGSRAASDNLYLSTNFDDVNNAKSEALKGNLLRASYSTGLLKVNQTYYWRVDEVNDNDPHSPWKGKVWKFSTTSADYDGMNGINFNDFAHLAMVWRRGLADSSGGLKDIRYGDVSGDGMVTDDDATLAAQYAAGLTILTDDQVKAADVSGDGKVTAFDAALISQYVQGIIDEFPVDEGLITDSRNPCTEPDWCDGADLDRNGRVDFADLLILAVGWCEKGSAGGKPIAHWAFDETSGSKAEDSAGDHPGTVYGAEWTTGKIGNALRFDGTDDHVSFGTDHALAPENLTIAMWIQPEYSSSTRYLIRRGGSGYAEISYQLTLSMIGRVQAFFGDGNSTVGIFTPNAPKAGEWTHVAFTRDGSEATVYVNGTDKTSTFYTLIPTALVYDLLMGGGSSFAYPGGIDDVRLYDRALTEEEIQTLIEEAGE